MRLISVLRGDFIRKFLALVAMDVNEIRIPTGTIGLGCGLRREKCPDPLSFQPAVPARRCASKLRLF